jgi:hypothetical protein
VRAAGRGTIEAERGQVGRPMRAADQSGADGQCALLIGAGPARGQGKAGWVEVGWGVVGRGRPGWLTHGERRAEVASACGAGSRRRRAGRAEKNEKMGRGT